MSGSATARQRGREAQNPLANMGLNAIAPNMEAKTRELTEDLETQQVIERVVEVPVPVLRDAESGISWVGNFGLSENGLFINANADEITESEWRNFFTVIRSIGNALQFIIGDWAAYGFDNFLPSYDEIAALTGYEASTIEVWASVCRNVDKLMRINSLPFAVHQKVTRLPQSEQRRWLQFAAQYNISSRELEQRIAANDDSPPSAPEKKRAVVSSLGKFARAADPFKQRVLIIAAKANAADRRAMIAELEKVVAALKELG